MERRNKTKADGHLPLVAGVREWHRLVPALSCETLYAAAAAGQLRVLRRGRRILIPRSALLEFLGEPVGESAKS